MRGEFIAVWVYLPNEIWLPVLADHEFPEDIFCELFREVVPALKTKLRPEEIADIIDDPIQAEHEFMSLTSDALNGERGVTKFLESVFDTFEEAGGDALSNSYFVALQRLIDKYSLRYDLRRPCKLCPTITGVFASLVQDLRKAVNADAHLHGLMNDFEDAVRDLRIDSSDARIRTCIVRQVNLLEALGGRFPGVSANTVGAICNQLPTWPHEEVKKAMKSLYAFTCDYPGIRHGGTPANAIRQIEMRDLVAMSVVLAGFLPYLTDQVDANVIYGRS